MIRKTLETIGVAAALGLSACGGGSASDAASASAPAPASSMGQTDAAQVDTSQVLMQAQQSPETTQPYPVDDGAVVMRDTSDATDAALVDGV